VPGETSRTSAVFFNTQPAKETELDDLTFPRIERSQLLQRLMNAYDLFAAFI
jgi:hypothetical protein